MSRGNNPYILVDGQLKPNPNYQRSADDTVKKPTSVVNPNALTVVSRPEDLMVAQDVTATQMPAPALGVI